MSKIDDLRVKYSSLKPDSFNRLVNGDETPTKKYAEFLYNINKVVLPNFYSESDGYTQQKQQNYIINNHKFG